MSLKREKCICSTKGMSIFKKVIKKIINGICYSDLHNCQKVTTSWRLWNTQGYFIQSRQAGITDDEP
jgi:hypothetical protein